MLQWLSEAEMVHVGAVADLIASEDPRRGEQIVAFLQRSLDQSRSVWSAGEAAGRECINELLNAAKAGEAPDLDALVVHMPRDLFPDREDARLQLTAVLRDLVDPR